MEENETKREDIESNMIFRKREGTNTSSKVNKSQKEGKESPSFETGGRRRETGD